MKEVKKERTESYTVYQAVDGTEFHEKSECEKYERSAHGVLRARITKLTTGRENAWNLMGGMEDHDIIGVKMNTESDLKDIQQFLVLENSYYSFDKTKEIFDIMEKAYNNNDIILFGINCDGDYYFINSRQNIIDNLNTLKQEII
jgi:hypothetical protein